MSKRQKEGQPGKVRKCSHLHLQRVERLFRESEILAKAESYVNRCLSGEMLGERALFPNLAGFGRDVGVGLSELARMGEKYPAVYDAMLAILEDGALNAERIPGKSALLAMNYFRRRLGYEAIKPEAKGAEKGEVRVVFDHDLSQDGQ